MAVTKPTTSLIQTSTIKCTNFTAVSLDYALTRDCNVYPGCQNQNTGRTPGAPALAHHSIYSHVDLYIKGQKYQRSDLKSVAAFQAGAVLEGRTRPASPREGRQLQSER